MLLMMEALGVLPERMELIRMRERPLFADLERVYELAPRPLERHRHQADPAAARRKGRR